MAEYTIRPTDTKKIRDISCLYSMSAVEIFNGAAELNSELEAIKEIGVFRDNITRIIEEGVTQSFKMMTLSKLYEKIAVNMEELYIEELWDMSYEHTVLFETCACEAAVLKDVLYLYFIIDTSASMEGIKISVLNNVFEELMPELEDIVEATGCDIKLSILEYSTGARWVIDKPIIFLVTDGSPTDSFDKPFERLKHNKVFESASRYCIAIGSDVNNKINALSVENIKRCIKFEELKIRGE